MAEYEAMEELVSGYTVVHPIGQGGQATVYLAEREHDGLRVALKVLDRKLRENAVFLERFVREYKLIASLNNEHVAKIYDQGFAGEHVFLAMEFLPAGTLATRIHEGLSTRGALRVALQIAIALDAIHSRDIVHRDLKPSNILFPKDGRLRVVDFGLAKMLVTTELAQTDPLLETLPAETAPTVASPMPVRRAAAAEPDDEPPTVATPATRVDHELASDDAALPSVYRTGLAFAGTPPYMAPEQWVSIDTRATDIWALGVILYELVCGDRPYSGTDDALRYQICSPDPVPMPAAFRDIPGELAGCIMSCLRKRPDDRPKSATELARMLTAIDLPAEWVPRMIDEIPAWAMAAATAHGRSRISGASELRVKESDRLALLAANLGALGITVREQKDGLEIEGGRVGGGAVRSDGDHRIAMAFATLGTRAAGPITVDDASSIATSYPGFAEALTSLRGQVEPASTRRSA